jgi:hypothetical protein
LDRGTGRLAPHRYKQSKSGSVMLMSALLNEVDSRLSLRERQLLRSKMLQLGSLHNLKANRKERLWTPLLPNWSLGMRFLAPTWILIMLTAFPLTAEERTPLSFEKDVLPIFNSHCLQCHGGVHQRNGLDLRTWESVSKGGKSGTVVAPGKPDESLLWKKVATDEMPKTDNKVSAADKNVLRAWIESGATATDRKVAVSITRTAENPGEVAKLINAHINRRLEASKIPASPRADDAEFLRRLYLDITGKPPASDETLAFLTDADPAKREKLIDALLASPDFGNHFAERWLNVFRQMSVNQKEWEPDRFQAWMAERFNNGAGWDTIVQEMLSVTGLLEEHPQAAFYYYNADMMGKFEPKIMTSNLAQVFLGVQLQCAECHDHPFCDYQQKDFWGMAAFFSITSTPNNPPNTRAVKDNLPKSPAKPGTPVTVSIPQGEARNAGTKVRAKFFLGDEPELDPAVSNRPALAKWLTSRENRRFAKASVNRLWAHFLGQGFVNPLNDFGDHNAPSHPELLEALTDEWVASNFDIKHMIRAICLGDAYQRASKTVAGNEGTEAEPLFARMTTKVLPPEELYDALCIALEVSEIGPPPDPKKKPNPKGPPPPSPRAVFVAAFRNPGEVDEPTELKLGVPHALKLMNESFYNSGGKVVERVMATAKTPEDGIDGLFIAILARHATEAERKEFAEFTAAQSTPRAGYDRVVWILLNSTAFTLNR